MRFWDSSALVPLIIQEPTSRQAVGWAEEDPDLIVWWGTRLEVVSALVRRGREQSFSESRVQELISTAALVLDRAVVIKPSQHVAARAEQMILAHTLRAGDALQLAAALLARQSQADLSGVVSFDHRLASAARAEAFRVLPE